MNNIKIGSYMLKDYLSFQNVNINFNTNKENNLILFTGPSGAGKSILMKAIASLFGNEKETLYSYSQLEILNNNIPYENFQLNGQQEDYIIKCIKNSKVKYFIDDKNISKSNLSSFTSDFFKHLHLKDTSEFQNQNILQTIDNILIKKDKTYQNSLNNYQKTFEQYLQIQQEIKKIEDEEKNVEELKEFLQFEIDKIKKVNPQVGEYEKLQEIKQRLSKKDQLEQKVNKVQEVVNNLDVIYDFLTDTNQDTSLYEEFQNSIQDQIHNFNSNIQDLEDIDIEEVLDRISDISTLVKKYGSIQECLNQLQQKQLKLQQYSDLTFTKKSLDKKLLQAQKDLQEQSEILTQNRVQVINKLEEKINKYLKYLHLDNCKIVMSQTQFTYYGKDQVQFSLNNVDLQTISSGEFNRLRLALLTAKTDFDISQGGILFLDEIDANLSGKESESIAKVVTKLSKKYQVFAISHQPQLTSQASLHFLVEKTNGVSTVKLLNDAQRQEEISRMISGEKISKEASIFAKQLLNKELSVG